MKKVIFYTACFISLIALIIRFGFDPISQSLGIKGRGGLKVTSLPVGATVYLNGAEAGKTPYSNENLEPQKYQVKIATEKSFWEGLVKVNPGTLAVLNRELAESLASSSGEVLTLEKGSGTAISSHPDGVSVEIDGKSYGQTPLKVTDLTPGEHLFLLSHDNYLKRSIRASIPDKMQLNLEVNLAVSEAVVESPPLPAITPMSKLIVKPTSTGFLRVRSEPSTAGKEVDRVSSGDSLTLEEELPGWYKIKTSDGLEGYVSAAYIQKQS